MDSALARDEMVPRYNYENRPFPTSFIGDYGHPVLFQLGFSFPFFIFGTGNWVSRLTPLICSILTSTLLFFYLKKKRGVEFALLGTLFVAILPWEINAATTTVYAASMTFFSFAALVCAEKYLDSDNKKFFAGMILFSLLATLMAYAGFLVVMAISAHIFFKRRLKKGILEIITFGASYLISFMISSAIVYLINPKTITETFVQLQGVTMSGRNILPVIGLPSIFIWLLWAGPLLVFLVYLLLKKTKLKDYASDIHLMFIVITVFIFFITSADRFRPFNRYFVIMIPSIIIIIISYGQNIMINFLRNWKKSIKYVLLFIALFFAMTILPHNVISLEPKMNFIKSFFSSFGLVLVPYSSNAGPIGFYVPGLAILFSWISVIVLSIITFFKKNKAESLMIIIMAIILSFNLFVSLNYAQLIGHSKPITASDHFAENLKTVELEKEVYIYYNHAMLLYFPQRENYQFKDFSKFMFDYYDFYEKTNKTGTYSVLLVNFPYIAKDHLIWKKLHNCERIYFSDKYEVEEYIFTCKN